MAKKYIEREEAIQYFKERSKDFIGHEPIPPALVIMGCANEVDAIPAADVVEVVRCGECEYWNTTWNPREAKNGEHYCPATDLFTTPDWFCADGERQEVQDDD